MTELEQALFGAAAQEDNTRDGVNQNPMRDMLSDAHKTQLLMDMLFATHRGVRHHGPGLHVEMNQHHVNLPAFASEQSDGPAGFARNIADMQGTADVNIVDTPQKVDGLLDIFRAMDMEQMDEPVADPAVDELDLFGGVSTDPELDFLSNPPLPPAAALPVAPPQTDQFSVGSAGFSASALNPLAELLRPDIADISRLGGGFSGYTEPDRMLERIRQLVRQL